MGAWAKLVAAREARLARESEPLKVVAPPRVGLDQLAPGADSENLAGLIALSNAGCADPQPFFAHAERDFAVQGKLLTFASDSDDGPGHPNATAYAEMHDSRRRDAAVVLLPYWNAERRDLRLFASLLAAAGIGCLHLSLPYHDERATPGTGYAREMACENLGLTLRANRQAVRDARAALGWLERRGYGRLGVVGISIGSSIASLVAAVDPRVRTAAMLLMADSFPGVVWTGTATRHVREGLERRFALGEVAEAWRVISPATHAERVAARLSGNSALIVSGAIDRVFLPELSQAYVARLRALGADVDWARYGCGHYTLGMPPYGVRALLHTIGHLRRWL